MMTLGPMRHRPKPYEDAVRALGLPRVGQLGYVAADIEAACRQHGARLGVARWYRPEIHKQEQAAAGRVLDQRFAIAVGYADGVQVEVLSVDGADRGHFLGAGAPADRALELHHVGVFVDDRDGCEARLNREGHATLQSGAFSFAPRSRTRVAYLDTRASQGIIVELIENRFRGFSIAMPEWYVRLGALVGYVHRIG
jgi:hypothetical protein